MDPFFNKKIEKQTIYEIYRACRLCGAGGGYKMPIIQNVVNIEGCDVELKQKIRECVQIEVHQDDRMPPLICELCVDKVNDFYEFLEMCRETNKRTRLRLGLPPQMMPRGAPDAGDCILGVTEPIYVNDEDSNEPLSDKKTKITRRLLGSKLKKEPEKEKKDNKIKVGTTPLGRQCRSVRVRPPTPPSDRRRDKEKNSDNTTLSKLQHSKSRRAATPPPKSILKKTRDVKKEDSPISPRLKRQRDKDAKPDLPAKRVKIAAKPPPRPVKPELKPLHPCSVCKQKFKAPQAVTSHMRSHTVGFTDPKCACNACGVWFSSVEEVAAHHKRHSSRSIPYVCRHCGAKYKLLHAYETHVSKCVPYEEVPDVECPKCSKTFPTQNLLDKHRCSGESGRKGGKCSKCSRSYMTRKSLVKHERGCTKREPIIDPEVQRRLKPLQVRVARCDPLLANSREHCDVSSVKADYGLDKECVYPYLASGLRIKSEPSDCMVKINDLDFASYVHWDSEDDSGDSDADNMDVSLFTKQRKVESLTACALKTIFSKKFLGKVPRKFRRIKIENIINSALNDSLSDLNINEDLTKCNEYNADDSVLRVKSSDLICADNDIISDKNDSGKAVTDDKDDDLFPKENIDSKVTNDDFDSLFNNSSDKGENNDKSVSLDNKLDDKVNDESDCNDSEDLVSDKSKIGENHLTDSQDDKIHNREVDSMLKTNSEEEKVEDSNHNYKEAEKNSKENNSHSEENKSNESIKSEEDVNKNELNDDEQKQSTMDSTKKYTSETTEEKIMDSTELKEVSTTTVTEMKFTKKVEQTLKQDEEIGEVGKSSLKESESDTTAHSINSKLIQENSEHSVDNTDTITEKQDNREVKEDSFVNGVSADDDNLNLDDLEDWGDEELDDSKLMADLDEQIGEKNDEIGKETENSKSAQTVRVKGTENTEPKETENARDVNNSVEKSIVNKEISDKEKGNKKSIAEEDIKAKEDLKIEDMDVDADKITLDDLLQKKDSKIMDCDNISDTEFNFD